MTDSIIKEECDYENKNDSNQMLIIILVKEERMKNFIMLLDIILIQIMVFIGYQYLTL